MRYFPFLVTRTAHFFQYLSQDKRLLGTSLARSNSSFRCYTSYQLDKCDENYWEPKSWSQVDTRDGTFTFYSEEFDQTFHNVRQGAKVEAISKFVNATDIVSIARARKEVTLLDICYGLGYNTAAAIDAIWQTNPGCDIKLYALELEPTVPLSAIQPQMLEQWSSRTQAILRSLAHERRIHETSTAGGSIDARLLLGDARTTIQTLVEEEVQADAIFLDPFSPRTCPQLWSVDFLSLVAKCLCPSGVIATYSFSASVRTALLECGLQIGSVPPDFVKVHHLQDSGKSPSYKRKKWEWSQGTVAAWTMEGRKGPNNLSQMELEHLETRAAIPFRDPTLSDNPLDILARQKHEQESSNLESTTQWFKRWGMK